MVGVAQQNLQDDKAGDLWSCGSIYQPSSQSRKISIGVMIDSLVKKRSGSTKEDEVAMPNEERVKSVVGNSTEVKNKVEGVTAATIGKHSEAPEQETSPWVTKRSFHQKESATDTVHAKQGSSLPAASGGQNKQHGVKDVPATYSVQLFANQTSTLQSADSKQKMCDWATQKSKQGKDGISHRFEDTAQGVFVSGKAVTETKTDKTENRCSGTLRMKLQEILGNVSSPNNHHLQSHSVEVDANQSMPVQNFGQTGERVSKRRQHSDTIETDSENPGHSIRRPVTRALARKRAPTKVQLNKENNKTPPSCKQKQQEKNTFSFVRGWSGSLHGTINSGTSRSTRKRSEIQSSRTKLGKISFPEKDNADKSQQAIAVSAVAPTDEKSSSLGIVRRFRSGALANDKKYHPKNNIKEKNSHPSPVTNKTDHGDLNSPKLPDNKGQREYFGNTSSKNAVDPEDNCQSPTFAIKTPIPSSFQSSLPKTDKLDQGVCSPALAEREFSVGDICSFRTLRTSKPDCYRSSVQKKSLDDVPDIKTSQRKKSALVMEEKYEDRGLKEESSSEERNSESSEEECRERETFSPGTGTAKSPKFILKPTKRLHSHEDIRFKEFSPTPPSPKGTGGSDWIPEPLEETQEDELARAVTLFARALKGLKCKIKLAASKKSSEILTSVVEGIHLQLQNIESQIQTDIEKLTSVSKSKRRRLETRFQEQQEQLNLMHEKFKEEVNQHLQDCRDALAGLEAHRIEFEGTTEKQRVSHRKLFLQVEEAVEAELNDAQRRITAINKLARGQLLQLKCVIAECLKEGVLS